MAEAGDPRKLGEGALFPNGALTAELLDRVYPRMASPLPSEAIERRKGSETGRPYDTVGFSYQYIVNRLNEVLGPSRWRVRGKVLYLDERKTPRGKSLFEATVRVWLQVGNPGEGGFLPIAERSSFGGYCSLLKADALKGAYTNAFKKAAALFGIGRQAYEGSLKGPFRDVQPGISERGLLPATEAQLRRLRARLRELGVDQKGFKAYLESLGMIPREGPLGTAALSRRDASKLLTDLEGYVRRMEAWQNTPFEG